MVREKAKLRRHLPASRIDPHGKCVSTLRHDQRRRKLQEKAYRGARNLLSLFRPDGSASNCYVYPFSVNGVRCEYYDEYANDQDGALYYLMKFYRFEEQGSSPISAAAEKVQDRNS